MLYPQNGDSFVTTDCVTSLHPMRYKYTINERIITSCVKTTEPIEMLFEVWTRVSPR